MLLNLIFELLAASPTVLSEVEALVKDIKAGDGGEEVLKSVLGGVKQIASTIEAAL